MIATVSTVKDTLSNIQRFVARNLAGGIDHMVIFLDTPDPEIEAWLTAHDHVTHIVADESWWGAERPDGLNERQRLHANVTRGLLTAIPAIKWLFHIDGDEVALIDRATIDGLAADVDAVRLKPLEAVSQIHWDASPTWFKRLLSQDDLHLLEVLGLITSAKNGFYFHGHIYGKAGLRPRLDRWLTIHRVVDAKQEAVELLNARGLRMLHLESYSGEDFVRKWSTILATPGVNLRSQRERTARAVNALLGKPLSPERREEYLMRIFEATTLDDFETLRELGLLVQIDPDQGTHRPALLPSDDRRRLEAMLTELGQHSKAPFQIGAAPGPVRKLLHVLDGSNAPSSRRSPLRRSNRNV